MLYKIRSGVFAGRRYCVRYFAPIVQMWFLNFALNYSNSQLTRR